MSSPSAKVPPSPHRPRFAGADLGIVATFILLLVLPALLALTGKLAFDGDFLQRTEHRNPFVAAPATVPTVANGSWQRDLERELGDAFPFRSGIIRTYGYVKFAWLDDVVGDVYRGKDGWLFLGYTDTMYMNGQPDDGTLQHVADSLAARASWCAAHRIRYVFLLAPNKSTVYPQRLPFGVHLVSPSAADRLLPMLRARGVVAVDVRDAMRAESRTIDVYTPGDTHWNTAGAYVGYEGVMRALHGAGYPDLVPRSAITSVTFPPGNGDLIAMAGVSDFMTNQWVNYHFPYRARDVPTPAYATSPSLGRMYASVTALDDRRLPTLVVFGDSYIGAVMPFFSSSFRRVLYMHHDSLNDTQFSESVISREHPDVVLQILVERNLVIGSAINPP